MPSLRSRLLAGASVVAVLTACAPAAARLHVQSPEVPRVVTTAEKAVKPPLTAAERARLGRWLKRLALKRWLAHLPKPYPHGLCGGDLPPCWIMERESNGNIYAVNPGHLGAPYGDPGDPWTHASGKWQFMPGTWNGYRGYAYAAAAPERVQDDKAREVWAGGAGASHWACC